MYPNERSEDPTNEILTSGSVRMEDVVRSLTELEAEIWARLNTTRSHITWSTWDLSVMFGSARRPVGHPALLSSSSPGPSKEVWGSDIIRIYTSRNQPKMYQPDLLTHKYYWCRHMSTMDHSCCPLWIFFVVLFGSFCDQLGSVGLLISLETDRMIESTCGFS